MFEQHNVNQEVSYLESLENKFLSAQLTKRSYIRKVNKHLESYGVISFE